MEVSISQSGKVELVDVFGDDRRILQSARVSTGSKASKGDEADRRLLSYLYKNQHYSPFEHVSCYFYMKLPIFVMRQIIRHRTFSFNEYSGRYSDMIEDCYVPSTFKSQSKENHQGSGEELGVLEQQQVKELYEEGVKSSWLLYEKMRGFGVSKETARMILPVSQYTECYFTANLRNIFHFLKLRMDKHTQYETRLYAWGIYKLLKNNKKLEKVMGVFDNDLEIRDILSYHKNDNNIIELKVEVS